MMRSGWDRFGEWRRRHPDLVFALAITLFLRIWFAALGAGSLIAHLPEMTPNIAAQYHGLAPAPNQGLWLLLTPWQRWDAIWYQRIAESGYRPGDPNFSFNPLLPILMNLFATILGNPLLASLVMTTVATFGAFGLLYRFSAELFDEAIAKRAVLYWAVFPTSFFLLGAYAESVLAVCALAALYFARHQRWWLSGIASAGATLARPIGFLIALPLLIEAWRSGKSMRDRWRTLPSLLGVAVAQGAWMLYLQIAFGDAMLWVRAEDAWQRVFVIPGQTVLWTIQNITTGRGLLANNILDFTLTAVTMIAVVLAIKKLPLAFSTFALVMLAVPLLSYMQSDSFALTPMASMGRRALIAFPAFISLAIEWHGKWKEPIWVLTSLSLQGILFIAFTQWYWVD